MADYDYEDESDFDDTRENLMKDLRKQIKTLSKEKSELSQELAVFKSGARERTVSEILSAKGVSPKVAKFIPNDIEGEENIGTWLEENADIFGFATNAATSAAVANPEERAAADRLKTLGESSQTPGRADDIAARIANAKSDDEVNAIWADARNYFL
jgi:hypothetical protein